MSAAVFQRYHDKLYDEQDEVSNSQIWLVQCLGMTRCVQKWDDDSRQMIMQPQKLTKHLGEKAGSGVIAKCKKIK